ncbi:EAL domain-containing protein [Geobacter sp. AOG2]|uniref:EAL domain-containing protein n=1 Tax=Geobacter sp. AOG2 TaxID=1566347 RepID=UPI001CC3AC33|nr:EAL domain-containing protein [Geobacter sp. AOG2]GFE61301.1 PTS lactose transporter subunit IIC [Geobacter sp. AOG2]
MPTLTLDIHMKYFPTAELLHRLRQKLSLLELAENISRRTFFLSIQRGLVLVLPLIMIGALALSLRNFPAQSLHLFLDHLFGQNWRITCDNMISGTFGIASLAVLCTFSSAMTMHHNQWRTGQFVSPVMVVVVVLSCFFVVTAPAESTSWEAAFSMSQGFMVALCVAAAGCSLFLRLSQCSCFQLPLGAVGHDPMVRDVLTVMPAGMATIAVFGAIRIILVMTGIPDLYLATNNLLISLFSHVGHGLGFGLVYSGLSQIFWFFGAHGPNLLFPIEQNFLVPASIANSAVAASGETPSFIFTKPFFDAFTRMGGSGSTLCLIAAILLYSRDGGNRKLCLFALIPALCNVNEPLLFGLPLVLNPVYFIPFVLTPITQTLITYAAMVLGVVPHPAPGVTWAWTTPVFVSGFAATGSVSGVFMQMANLAMGVALYYPFVRLADDLRERQGILGLNTLLQTATGCETGQSGRKCIDRPGEEGRLAKALAHDLQNVLTHDATQLFLEYQPQINVTENRVRGVEALLRWNHPTYGRIPPPVTIALAEDTGCIDQLGLFVLNLACRQRAEWKGKLPNDLVISVNVSPSQLLNQLFCPEVADSLTRAGLHPDQLELEITESTVLAPDARTIDTLRRIRNSGVHVAIDDFGMGHASLRYLKELPVDTIKIDRSLTDACEGDINDHIVRSIVELSRNLGMTTITEGIEKEEQLGRFRHLGCEIYQGYLFSKPLSHADCLAFILARQEHYGVERKHAL